MLYKDLKPKSVPFQKWQKFKYEMPPYLITSSKAFSSKRPHVIKVKYATTKPTIPADINNRYFFCLRLKYDKNKIKENTKNNIHATAFVLENINTPISIGESDDISNSILNNKFFFKQTILYRKNNIINIYNL